MYKFTIKEILSLIISENEVKILQELSKNTDNMDYIIVKHSFIKNIVKKIMSVKSFRYEFIEQDVINYLKIKTNEINK